VEPEIFLQKHGIGAVVLGAADPERLAVTLQHFGIDRVNDNKVISMERLDESAAGGFNSQGDRLLGEAFSQLSHPRMDGFGCLLQNGVLGLASASGLDPKVVFLIGPVDTNGGGVGDGLMRFRCWVGSLSAHGFGEHAGFDGWKSL